MPLDLRAAFRAGLGFVLLGARFHPGNGFLSIICRTHRYFLFFNTVRALCLQPDYKGLFCNPTSVAIVAVSGRINLE